MRDSRKVILESKRAKDVWGTLESSSLPSQLSATSLLTLSRGSSTLRAQVSL